MTRFATFFALVCAALVGCKPDPLTKQEVQQFLMEYTATQNRGEASIEPFKEGLAKDFMFFSPDVDSAQTMQLENITADWFDSDTVTLQIEHIEVLGENASVFGTTTDDYGFFQDNNRFHGVVGRENGKLVWKRWFGVSDWKSTTQMLSPRTESEEAERKYWDMYRSIMRGDFVEASLHADTALAADDQLAMAYFAKMIEASWITGVEEDFQSAYNRATELVEEDDFGAKYAIQALGLRGEERIVAATRAMAHCPHDPMLMSWTSFWLGDTEESMAMLKLGLERWPYVASFHNLMGYRLMSQGDIPGAKKYFEFQTRLLPDAANVWDSLGDYYMKAGDKAKARKAFEKALEIDPEFKFSIRKLAELDGE